MRVEISIIMVLMIQACFFTGIVEGEKDNGNPDFMMFDPITINCEEDLTAENGIVSGSGREDDPFLVNRWWINVSSGTGMILENVTSHLLIYEVAVTHFLDLGNPLNVTDSGILIKNCSNIRIERSYIYYFNIGLEIIGSDNIRVHDSSFIENHNGIMMEADNSSITGCICSYNTRYGVFINNSNHLVLRDVLTDANSFTIGQGAGVQLINCSDIIMEECFGTLNYGDGISVIGSLDGSIRGRDLLISNCYSDSNINGIQVSNMDRVRIEDTRFRYNSYGVNLLHVTDASIKGSFFWKNSYGFVGNYLSGSLVDGNRFESNENGLVLDTSLRNKVMDNYFVNTTEEAVKVVTTKHFSSPLDLNVIFRNTFENNNNNGDQAIDGTGTTTWSEEGMGNYWSDWQGNDTDMDGVVDREKELTGGAIDPYPLLFTTDPENRNEAEMDITEASEERGPEYWIVVSISAMTSIFIGMIILYNRKSARKR